jgi:hypothetical protein
MSCKEAIETLVCCLLIKPTTCVKQPRVPEDSSQFKELFTATLSFSCKLISDEGTIKHKPIDLFLLWISEAPAHVHEPRT